MPATGEDDRLIFWQKFFPGDYFFGYAYGGNNVIIFIQ